VVGGVQLSRVQTDASHNMPYFNSTIANPFRKSDSDNFQNNLNSFITVSIIAEGKDKTEVVNC